jgi:hypothetical protein
LTKVVSMRGTVLPTPGEPVPEVVETIERILEMARAGEIKGIGYCLEHADSSVSADLKGEVGYKLLGKTIYLQHWIMDSLKGEEA